MRTPHAHEMGLTHIYGSFQLATLHGAHRPGPTSGSHLRVPFPTPFDANILVNILVDILVDILVVALSTSFNKTHAKVKIC